jgi:hypothetical protein
MLDAESYWCRPWEESRLSTTSLLLKHPDWLRSHFIGFDQGQSVLEDPSKTEVLRGRRDFPSHGNASHSRLLLAGMIVPEHWFRGDEFVRVLQEVHGFRVNRLAWV